MSHLASEGIDGEYQLNSLMYPIVQIKTQKNLAFCSQIQLNF